MNQDLGRVLPEAKRVLLALLLAWMIYNFVVTIRYVAQDYTGIPVMDYWRVAEQWRDYKSFHWLVLWKQHNEHRIVFPEITYMADMLFLHGRMYLPLAVSVLCYFSVWFILVWAAYSQSVIRPGARETALLCAGIIMFWKGCSCSLATPFQLAFTMQQAAVGLSLLWLTLAIEAERRSYIFAAVGAGIVATYTAGNGMLVWPVLLVVGWVIRLTKRQFVIVLAAAVVSIGAYFLGYHRMPSAMGTNIKHPVQLLKFLMVYLGMPFDSFKSPPFGIKLGAVNLILMCGCCVVAFRDGLIRSRLAALIFGGYLFTLVSAAMISLGRLDLYDFDFNQAKAPRYITMPTAAWAFLAVALIWLLSKVSTEAWWMVAAIAILGLFAYQTSRSEADFWLERTRNDAQDAQVTVTMFQNHLFYPEQVQTLFPAPNFVEAYVPVLQQDHKSIWFHGEDKWLGQNVAHLMPQKVPLAGKITRVVPIPEGLELFGWADDARSLTRDHAVLFVDEDGTIVGFGRRPAAGIPADLNSWDTPDSLAFVGFVSLVRPLREFTVFVRTSRNGLRPLTGRIRVPEYTQLATQSDTPALPGIIWQPDANWTINGSPVWPMNGPAPKVVFGSWGGSDEKTGTLSTAPFERPENGCLVLPVLHGLSTYGQSVELEDADTGQTLLSIPMLDGKAIWHRWKIPIGADVHHLTVIAKDEGRGPFQWLAVGTPERCP